MNIKETLKIPGHAKELAKIYSVPEEIFAKIARQPIKEHKDYTVLSIDVGRTYGVCISRNGNIVYTTTGKIKKDTFEEIYQHVNELIVQFDVDRIISAYPTAGHTIIAFQNKVLGLLFFIAGYNGLAYCEYNDSSAKKRVLGNGRASKEEIQTAFPLANNEHEADACMFAELFWLERAIERYVTTGKP